MSQKSSASNARTSRKSGLTFRQGLTAMAAQAVGIDPDLAAAAGDDAYNALKLIRKARTVKDPKVRAEFIADARRELKYVDANRHPELFAAIEAKLHRIQNIGAGTLNPATSQQEFLIGAFAPIKLPAFLNRPLLPELDMPPPPVIDPRYNQDPSTYTAPPQFCNTVENERAQETLDSYHLKRSNLATEKLLLQSRIRSGDPDIENLKARLMEIDEESKKIFSDFESARQVLARNKIVCGDRDA
ncbi:MAG: hypothetical protein KDE14_02940 [Rhodobacteraceae bacterium]|nr:hypothetical protein [Paracoccaceae bacterium]